MAYLVICTTALVAALLTLFSGFGLGTLLLPAFAVFFPMSIAVAGVAVVHLANNVFKLGLVGRHADWKVVILFGIPGMLAAAGGAYLLTLLSGLSPLFEYTLVEHVFQVQPVALVVGLLMVLFAFLEILPLLSGMAFKRRYLPLGGLVSGFFGGLSGHQGAFRSAFLVKAGLSREAFIGTGVACAVMIDVARLSVYDALFFAKYLQGEDRAGPTKWIEEIGKSEAGLLVAAGVVSAFAGSFLGTRLMKKITIQSIQRLIGGMLILLGIAIASGILSQK